MPLSQMKARLTVIFIILCQYSFSQYIPFCEKGKWGFATTDGTIAIDCIYEEVELFSNDSLAKAKKGGKYGYIDTAGKTVIPFEYDKCTRIYEVYFGSSCIGLNIDSSVHLHYNWFPEDVNTNRYIVSKGGKYGVLSLRNGKPEVLVVFSYSKIQFDFNKKLFHCSINDKLRYFIIDGTELSERQVKNTPVYDYAGVDMVIGNHDAGNVPTIVYSNGKAGVVLENDTIVPTVYDSIITDAFDEGYFPGYDVFGVMEGNQWGLVDGSNNTLLPIQFDRINFDLSKEFRHWSEYQRMFVVENNNRWGILGKTNDSTDTIATILPFEYDAVNSFYFFYLLVQKDSKYQIFNHQTNRFVNNNSYSSITKYEHGSVDDFTIFQVTNKLGQTVFVGENGIEFFTD